MKVISVVGARPNFMKVAPIYRAFKQFKINPSHFDSAQCDKRRMTDPNTHTDNLQPIPYSPITHLICHTGQHYDEKMSKIFFDELGLPKPDYYLGVGGGSHAEQTARIMIEFEKVLLKEKPDLVIVVGDVNSTVACSLTAVKLGIKVAHVEAGLRSFDRSMPEEINRILTDSISDYLFVTERSGLDNLKREGIHDNKVHFVGHVMIDSLINYLPEAEGRYNRISSELLSFRASINHLEGDSSEQQTSLKPYILVTMHRPSNVDFKDKLSDLIGMLNRLSEKRKIIFPIHPRTKQNIEKFGLDKKLSQNLILIDPIGYIDFIALIKNAEVILTDSGGIQEESTFLGVQCVTLRTTTERPITVEIGTNHLVGDDFNEAERVVNEILSGKKKEGKIPELWDGKASERIIKILIKDFNG